MLQRPGKDIAGIQVLLVRKDVELARFTCEAGKVYFYRTRITSLMRRAAVSFFFPIAGDKSM
jgi:hypothetical protein